MKSASVCPEFIRANCTWCCDLPVFFNRHVTSPGVTVDGTLNADSTAPSSTTGGAGDGTAAADSVALLGCALTGIAEVDAIRQTNQTRENGVIGRGLKDKLGAGGGTAPDIATAWPPLRKCLPSTDCGDVCRELVIEPTHRNRKRYG